MQTLRDARVPYSLEPVTILPFRSTRNFADVMKIMKFDMGELPWIVWVDPI